MIVWGITGNNHDASLAVMEYHVKGLTVGGVCISIGQEKVQILVEYLVIRICVLKC